MLHSHLSGWPGRYHSGWTTSTLPWTQKKHTLPVPPNDSPVTHVLHTLCPLWSRLSFGAGFYSPRALLQLMLPQVVSLCSSHTINQLQPHQLLSRERGGSEAGVKREQNWWGGALLAALLHEIFNFKLCFTTLWWKGLATLTPSLNSAFNTVLSLLLVPLIQPRSSCLRGLSEPPHALIPLHPVVDGRPITKRPQNALHFWKRCG